MDSKNMMAIDTLFLLEKTSGSKAKQEIITNNKNDLFFTKILELTYNPYKQYHVIKVPKVELRTIKYSTYMVWQMFFGLLDECNNHTISGNNAIERFHNLFSGVVEEQEYWMRKVLERHLNVGITATTINKCIPNLIPEFNVQLAHKFEDKRIKNETLIAVEPKLDGFRCIAILVRGKCVLYSRNGKNISENYRETIIKDLEKAFSDGTFVLDGELMGKDFKSTTEQVHRKTGANVSDHYYNVFDFVKYNDWVAQKSTLSCQQSREKLENLCIESKCTFVKVVPREIIKADPKKIKFFHDLCVKQKYEGAMVKLLNEPYKFGRGHNVMKYKEFFDVDVPCIGFEEGEDKYSGALGALQVDYNGKVVKVGSGFTDEERKEIWDNRTNYRGKMLEVRAFEETEDKSLRFPTFRGWRPDKD